MVYNASVMLQASKIIFLFLLYFAAARMGLELDAVAGFASLVWPAAGIALALLFLGGYKLWPGIFLGAFLVNFLNGAPPLTAFGIGLGNTLEAVLGAFALKKVLKFNPSLERLKDALSLINISILSPVISASFGVVSLYLAGLVTWHMLEPAWFAWWVGDLLGILIVAPFIFVWSKWRNLSLKKISREYAFEVALLFTILIIVCLMSFGGFLGIDSRRIPVTQVLYPILIWFSIRLNPRLSFSAIFLTAVIAVWGTVVGVGPFIRGGLLSENLLYLQSFLATIALTFTILTTVMAERKRLQSLKDEFISAASHELRTPITTLKAYTELIASQLKKNSGRSSAKKTSGFDMYISRMNDQINRLIDLVYELLDMSRIEAGKIKINPEKFNLTKLIEEIAADFKRTVKSHTVILNSQNNIDVNADRFRISQVLINLISNAIKFSPESNKVIVTISKDKNIVTVSVKDFGRGLDPKHHTEVFSRFFQAEQNLKASSAGLGLGLYISSEIIKQHKGEIWVESKINKGSTFSFKLPVKG